MKIILKFFLLTILIVGTGFIIYYYSYSDIRSNAFFSDILKVKNAKIQKICLDCDISSFGVGEVTEVYKLSDETLISFQRSFNVRDTSNYLKNFSNVISWTKTPNIDMISKIKLHIPLIEHKKCFNEEFLRGLLGEKDNFCSLAYTSDDFFILAVIDSKTKLIYIVENTW